MEIYIYQYADEEVGDGRRTLICRADHGETLKHKGRTYKKLANFNLSRSEVIDFDGAWFDVNLETIDKN